MKRFGSLAFAVVAAAGCGSTPPPAPQTGTALLTFSVSKSARTSPTLVDPLKGGIYGDIFHTEDTTINGPRPGVKAVASTQLLNQDLTADDAISQPWTSPAIDPGNYIWLGLLDVKGLGANNGDPANGDPVTLPINKFDVKAGQQTAFTVRFDLIYNK